eukprot:gene17418-biopygen13672
MPDGPSTMRLRCATHNAPPVVRHPRCMQHNVVIRWGAGGTCCVPAQRGRGGGGGWKGGGGGGGRWEQDRGGQPRQQGACVAVAASAGSGVSRKWRQQEVASAGSGVSRKWRQQEVASAGRAGSVRGGKPGALGISQRIRP